MNPTDILRKEHEVVLSVLSAMEKIARLIRETGEIDHENIEKFVDFSRNFTDGCHHQKEEHLLFPKMAERGFSADSGPIGMMLFEHTEGRKFIAQVDENIKKSKGGDNDALRGLAEGIFGYVFLLRNHIEKENNILFNMADDSLTDEDLTELSGKFDEVDERTSEEVNNKYLVFARELEGKYRGE